MTCPLSRRHFPNPNFLAFPKSRFVVGVSGGALIWAAPSIWVGIALLTQQLELLFFFNSKWNQLLNSINTIISPSIATFIHSFYLFKPLYMLSSFKYSFFTHNRLHFTLSFCIYWFRSPRIVSPDVSKSSQCPTLSLSRFYKLNILTNYCLIKILF